MAALEYITAFINSGSSFGVIAGLLEDFPKLNTSLIRKQGLKAIRP